jgi:hypothetical protein
LDKVDHATDHVLYRGTKITDRVKLGYPVAVRDLPDGGGEEVRVFGGHAVSVARRLESAGTGSMPP